MARPSMDNAVAQAKPATAPVLEARGLRAGYGEITVVDNIDLAVQRGQVVALLGANGAGKTTTILTLAGELQPLGGDVLYKGEPTRSSLHARVRAGMRLITEERCVFMSMTVRENLRLAHKDIGPAVELFPELKPLLRRSVGLLSGGEQQIVALARTLAGRADVLLADELSLGLAPLIVDRLLAAVRKAADNGLGVLLVEQQVARAVQIADYVYVISRGQVIMQGTRAEMSGRMAEIERSYFAGLDDAGSGA
jgi:branched-chain amino acid transport system ATP-binding protein